MMKLLVSVRLELYKLLHQRGTWAGPAILLVIAGLTVWALWRHGPDGSISHGFGTDMVVGGKLVTGLLPPRYVMEPCLMVLVPMLVAAVAGGLMASEARGGLLRTWLCRPVSRQAVLTGKQIAAWVHATGLTFFLGAVALGLGYIFFGGGDLTDFRSGDGLVLLDEPLGLQRLALAYGLAALVMCAIASLALMASVIFENPLVAAGVTVASLPGATIIGLLPYFAKVKPYLLTTYLDYWIHAFRGTIQWSDFTTPLACIGAYCVIPFIIGSVIMHYRDVTS